MTAPGDSAGPDQPSIARIYDYCLGGSHNFEVDREAARRIVEKAPEMVATWRENRSFLRRAVTHCLNAGDDQFLDLGSGIPAADSPHEIAARLGSRAKVVYVDVDPVAVAHAQIMLGEQDDAVAFHGDVGDPDPILGDDRLRTVLDLSRPVTVLMVSVLHFIPNAAEAVRRFSSVTVPGSRLVIAHATSDPSAAWWQRAQEGFSASGVLPGRSSGFFRSGQEIADLFDGYDLDEPGLVRTDRWRPDGPPDDPGDQEPYPAYAGSGRRRDTV